MPLSIPSLTVREYDPETGAFLGNVSVLNFGNIVAGLHSPVKVIDILFKNITNVGNIKLGIVSNGGINVNPAPTDVSPTDGSSANGHFGIESSSFFDSARGSQSLTRHFPGINASKTASDDNNVSVGSKASTVSDYIYMDIEISAGITSESNGAYKVFFDFS